MKKRPPWKRKPKAGAFRSRGLERWARTPNERIAEMTIDECGKIGYISKHHAKGKLRMLVGAGKLGRVDGAQPSVYRCERCGWFHIGNATHERKAAKRDRKGA